MNVFVSYTRRDGSVKYAHLVELHQLLSHYCKPFVHAIEEPNIRWQQLTVLLMLLKSHCLLLIESPGVKESLWVRFELILAKIKLMPILRIDISDIPSRVPLLYPPK